MALELAQRRPGLRGHRLQVLRALRRHRRRDEHARRHGPVGRGGRLLLRPAPRRRPARSRCASARWSGSSRCSPSRCSTTRRSTGCPASASGMELVPEEPPRPGAAHHLHASAETAEAHGRRLLAIPSRERLERVLRYVLDENEFLSPYGIRSLSPRPPRAPVSSSRRRRASTASTTCPANRTPACSAATRTGAGRSGSRSTTC